MRKTGLLVCVIAALLLPRSWSGHLRVLAGMPRPQSASEGESPRLKQLEAQLRSGDRAALDSFWNAVAKEHAPLVEPATGEAGRVLVTFLWRAAPGALDARGYDARFVEVAGARHDPINWRFQLADGLQYLAR